MTSNTYDRPRLISAHLPNGKMLRLAEGLKCPCGRIIRNFPRDLGDGNFSIVCDCHADMIVCEPAP